MKGTSAVVHSGAGQCGKVAQDLQRSGAAAQFGRGMVQDVTSVIMKSFAKCIADDIGRSARGEGPVQRNAAPVKGFSIAMQARMTALKRFFGGLFGALVLRRCSRGAGPNGTDHDPARVVQFCRHLSVNPTLGPTRSPEHRLLACL